MTGADILPRRPRVGWYPGWVHRLALLAVVVGCYNPSVGVGNSCSELGACPPGQQCYDGHCLIGPPGQDADTDGPAIDAPDGSTTDGAPSDGAVDAPMADAFVSPTWLTPTAIPGVNTTGMESDPCLTPDHLTIVFQRNADLYIGTRANKSAAFTAVALTALNTASDENSPEISADGHTIYFTSDRVAVGNNDVYVSTLSGTVWSAPTLVAELTSASDDGDLGISPDGLTAVVVKGSNFVKATRATTSSAWGTPATITNTWPASPAAPSINTAGDIYLHGATPRDLFVSRRTGSTYGIPSLIAELSTVASRDAAPDIGDDDLYMAFEKDGDLYETHR